MKQDIVRNALGFFSKNGWEPGDVELTFEEWCNVGKIVSTIERRVAWVVGDWWRYGEHKYGERATRWALGELGELSFQTVMNYGWVAKKVETSRRREVLSFGHHEAVASFSPSDQSKWLSRAEKNGWPLAQLRTEIAVGRRRAKHAEIAKAAREVGDLVGPFPLLYADPPWEFETYSELGKELSPDEHYPVMSYDAIEGMLINGKTVGEIAHKEAALFLWCTSSNFHLALNVMKAWGFQFKTSAVWDKQRTGTGYVFLNQHEVLLYGTRGLMPAPLAIASSIFSYPRGEHSAKPPEIRDALDRMYPEFDRKEKLELFCRDEVPGWTTWGLEA